jgi:hypothetical protein
VLLEAGDELSLLSGSGVGGAPADKRGGDAWRAQQGTRLGYFAALSFDFNLSVKRHRCDTGYPIPTPEKM